MTGESLPISGNISFEGLKKINEFDAEYWSARELQPLLGYVEWRTFENAIEKAKVSCEQSGNDPNFHFVASKRISELGKGAKRPTKDYDLSRFACYLIAQNGDSRKPEIAIAQKYFAIQARRQELSDTLAADKERLEIRKQASEEFKALSGAARQAGVQDKMFGVFHDAGYKGMYNGLGRDEIKTKKSIPKKDNLMDRMDTTELAANQFRMTQAREKLARNGIKSQSQAIQVHEDVGKEVRNAIIRIGGTLPEDIPAAEHIKEVEKRIKTATPILQLDEKDAMGLIGTETE